MLVTADGGWRRGSAVPLKANADEALASTPSIEHVVVVRRTEEDVRHDRGARPLVPRPHGRRRPRLPARADGLRGPALPALHLGHHGQAQGHHAHHRRLPRPRSRSPTSTCSTSTPSTDVYWCAADIGWVTGHSYIVYGPLANGATSVIYEGTPDHPHKARLWEIVERYGVTQLYTAPTAIRTFMKWGTDEPAKHDLSTPPPARHGGRAHQPRGVDVVPGAHRRRALPDRRHVVADRDRGAS